MFLIMNVVFPNAIKAAQTKRSAASTSSES